MGAPPLFFGGGAGSARNTKWLRLTPNSMPGFIFIHAAVWPQNTKVTDRQTDRQTAQTDKQDRQRSDSTGQTVLPFSQIL